MEENITQKQATSQVKAFLVLLETDELSDADIGRQYEILTDGIRIGNTPTSNIILQALKRPCELHVSQKRTQWYVHDVIPNGSRAFLNKLPFQTNHIRDGAILEIAPYAFEFCLGGGIKKQFFERIYDSLTEDILTKAYNRRYFNNLLEWELRRYQQWEDNRRTNIHLNDPRPMSILMFDLDHFGKVNKEHDHQTGDEILKGVVQRIKARVRSTDIIARYGGEEFCVYLPDTGYEQAMELAEKIRQRIAEEAFLVPPKVAQLNITISVGVATYQAGMDVKEFIRVANQWMLRAKEQGRNRVLG